jgi:glycine amidinotransferase
VSCVIKKILVVNTATKKDPLEEIIVGIVEGAVVPPWDVKTNAVMHHEHLLDYYRQRDGQPWLQELLAAAMKSIEEYVHIFEAKGVTVRRPVIYDTADS